MDKKETKKKPRGLGKGINALFEGYSFEETPKTEEVIFEKNETEKGVTTLKIRDIEPNKNQPRKTFDKEKLEALSESIKEHGIIQPILVKKEKNEMFTIIAGERRWRAAKLAGIKEVPCIIKEFSEKELMEIALIENLQREDLNPIEEAEGYKLLMETFDMRQEDVAKSVGKSRSAVANALRLNNLCKEVKDMVSNKALSQGHARTLITVTDKKNQIMLAEKIIKEDLSVRKTEQLVAYFEKFGTLEKEEKEIIEPSMKKYYSSIEDTLSKKFGTKVKIQHGKNKSKIEIEYYSPDDLERLLFELQ